MRSVPQERLLRLLWRVGGSELYKKLAEGSKILDWNKSKLQSKTSVENSLQKYRFCAEKYLSSSGRPQPPAEAEQQRLGHGVAARQQHRRRWLRAAVAGRVPLAERRLGGWYVEMFQRTGIWL